MRRLCAAVLCLLCLASPLRAWSAKEHILLTRCAVRELLDSPDTPPAMKQWLRDAQGDPSSWDDQRTFLMDAHVGLYPHGIDGLAFWAVVPDLQAAASRDRQVEPFGVPEDKLHFIDVELLMPNAADRSFAPDLSHKPALADIPRDSKDPRWKQAGMLPFRIENCYQELVHNLRTGRLVDRPGQFPRDEHATKWAGMLAHYAADNCMPMHATVDYQAYSFFPGVAKPPKVHFDMEYILVDGELADYPAIREALWTAFRDQLQKQPAAAAQSDIWKHSVELSLLSYDALPLIGQAARAAYLDADGKPKPFDADAFVQFSGEVDGQKTTLLDMKARQWARATRWIESLWLAAWQSLTDRQREDARLR